MNDKDKEAFEKWFQYMYDNCVEFRDWNMCDILCDEKEQLLYGWQAACEYKQKEIDEFKNVIYWTVEQNGKVTRHISIAEIEKLQAENTNLIKKISYALSIMKDNHWDAEESEIEYQVYKILENALNEKL